MRVVLLLVALAFSRIAAAAGETLVVYTYSSFTADWGPGPAIEREFEATCGCDLEFVALDDGVALLSRIRLEGSASKADIVLGLDNNLIDEASKTGLFASSDIDLSHLDLPIAWSDSTFVPYDFGYFAFVYDQTRVTSPPTSLKALVNGPADQKILIQDPRTSTPGLGLLLWIRSVYGDESDAAWQMLQKRVLSVSKGWSESYGLFLKGEAPFVLSYTTSPAYHQIVEDDQRFAAAAFDEGHYLQIEVAARLASSPNAELAERFLEFMVSERFQQHIPTGNWMYPVLKLRSLPTEFSSLVQPTQALQLPSGVIGEHRKRWIDDWLASMTK